MSMTTVQVFLAFTTVTYPALMLVPALVTSLLLVTRPNEIAFYFSLLLANYVLVVVAAAWSLGVEGEGVALAFQIVSAGAIALVLRRIVTWTILESVYNNSGRPVT